MKNKIIAHLTIILILVGVFCNVCTTYNCISFYDSSVYAEADNWTSCDTSDLVTAFRYYCKSRNLALEDSAADALTTFTTTSFNNICSTLGIDITNLSAQLKKTTSGNYGLRFLFSNTGITAYNRIFAEFLQNNNLSVGDEVENKIVYSSKMFTDLDGHTCIIYKLNNTYGFSPVKDNIDSYILKFGTNLKYDPIDFKNLYDNGVYNFSINVSSGYTANGAIYHQESESYSSFTRVNVYGESALISENLNSSSLYGYFYDTNPSYLGDCYRYGSFIITENSSNPGVLHFAKLVIYDNSYGKYYEIIDISEVLYNEDAVSDGNVYLTTNNTTINNNNYNNNYTIIYNDGDTYISDDDDEPLPTTPPSGGGGGGGGDNPTNPDIPPVDPTPTPPPSIPDWDIELPEMPTGNDWLLYGLEKKFPWDIPFNLMYMLSLFAADPETPHFEGTLDLKIVQWDYDIDLAPFDDIAGYVRNIEFIGFLIGLMLLTNKLIWG